MREVSHFLDRGNDVIQNFRDAGRDVGSVQMRQNDRMLAPGRAHAETTPMLSIGVIYIYAICQLDQPTGQPTGPGACVPDKTNPARPCEMTISAQAEASRQEPIDPARPDPCDSAIFYLSSFIWRYCQPFSGFTQPFGYSELRHFLYSELSYFYLQ
jgi:hypothetical protein